MVNCVITYLKPIWWRFFTWKEMAVMLIGEGEWGEGGSEIHHSKVQWNHERDVRFNHKRQGHNYAPTSNQLYCTQYKQVLSDYCHGSSVTCFTCVCPLKASFNWFNCDDWPTHSFCYRSTIPVGLCSCILLGCHHSKCGQMWSLICVAFSVMFWRVWGTLLGPHSRYCKVHMLTEQGNISMYVVY